MGTDRNAAILTCEFGGGMPLRKNSHRWVHYCASDSASDGVRWFDFVRGATGRSLRRVKCVCVLCWWYRAWLWRIRPCLLRTRRKVDRGMQVYAAQKCSVCHSIAGKGNKKGALDDVGSKLTRRRDPAVDRQRSGDDEEGQSDPQAADEGLPESAERRCRRAGRVPADAEEAEREKLEDSAQPVRPSPAPCVTLWRLAGAAIATVMARCSSSCSCWTRSGSFGNPVLRAAAVRRHSGAVRRSACS